MAFIMRPMRVVPVAQLLGAGQKQNAKLVRAALGRRGFADEKAIPTALYDEHVKLGGKMVPFAGYSLPVQYKDGVLPNHVHVRTAAGLFDVSHMGQVRLHGKDRVAFLESLVVCDVEGLKDHQASLSVFTNAKGGIIDDCIITKRDKYLAIVLNAGCKDKDMAHIKEQISKSKKDVKLEYLQDQSLVALQGPKAAEVLARLIPKNVDLKKWPFMSDGEVQVAGIPCTITRSGYTGEDGFEISVPNDKAAKLWNAILEHKEVLPAGLGVRDSLRLEAGLCLYGHDLNEDITPVEAALAWTIGKRRREQGGFLGYDIIKKQLTDGVSKKRVGLTSTGAPAREGTVIYSQDGQQIGTVTSGTFSPSLKQNVSMGYVQTASAKVDTPIQVEVRGKKNPGKITKMPFVPTRYHKV